MINPVVAIEDIIEFRLHLGLVSKDGKKTFTHRQVVKFTQDWQSKKGKEIKGSTLVSGIGIWEGETEPTISISVYSPLSDYQEDFNLLLEFGDSLACHFEQWIVLLMVFDPHGTLMYSLSCS